MEQPPAGTHLLLEQGSPMQANESMERCTDGLTERQQDMGAVFDSTAIPGLRVLWAQPGQPAGDPGAGSQACIQPNDARNLAIATTLLERRYIDARQSPISQTLHTALYCQTFLSPVV
jgi:hypothetical protein